MRQREWVEFGCQYVYVLNGYGDEEQCNIVRYSCSIAPGAVSEADCGAALYGIVTNT